MSDAERPSEFVSIIRLRGILREYDLSDEALEADLKHLVREAYAKGCVDATKGLTELLNRNIEPATTEGAE